MQIQASSAKLVDTLALTSTTTKVSQNLPHSLLNVFNVVDVPSYSTLHIFCDGVKEVVVDATTNKVAEHANVTTDFTTVVNEILYDNENKVVDSDVIADMTEGVTDEVLG